MEVNNNIKSYAKILKYQEIGGSSESRNRNIEKAITKVKDKVKYVRKELNLFRAKKLKSS